MPANRFAGWAERSVNAGPTIVVTRPQCFGWVAPNDDNPSYASILDLNRSHERARRAV